MLSRILAVISIPLFFACTVVDDDYEVAERSGGKPCVSSEDCPNGMSCTTEADDPDCDPAPNCRPGQPCLAVCYGVCEPLEACGDVLCPSGTVCCNESCGICTEPDGVCTQQLCSDPEEL